MLQSIFSSNLQQTAIRKRGAGGEGGNRVHRWDGRTAERASGVGERDRKGTRMAAKGDLKRCRDHVEHQVCL